MDNIQESSFDKEWTEEEIEAWRKENIYKKEEERLATIEAELQSKIDSLSFEEVYQFIMDNRFKLVGSEMTADYLYSNNKTVTTDVLCDFIVNYFADDPSYHIYEEVIQAKLKAK